MSDGDLAEDWLTNWHSAATTAGTAVGAPASAPSLACRSAVSLLQSRHVRLEVDVTLQHIHRLLAFLTWHHSARMLPLYFSKVRCTQFQVQVYVGLKCILYRAECL